MKDLRLVLMALAVILLALVALKEGGGLLQIGLVCLVMVVTGVICVIVRFMRGEVCYESSGA